MDTNTQNNSTVVEPTGAPTNTGLAGFNRFNEWLKKFFTSFGNFIKVVVGFFFGWLYRPIFRLFFWVIDKSPNFVKRLIYGAAGTSYSAVQKFRATCEEQGRQQVFISTNSTYKYIGFAIVTIAMLTFFSVTLLFTLNNVEMNLHLFQLPKGFMNFIHRFWSGAGNQIYINLIFLPGLLAAVLVYNMDALIVRSANAVYKLLGTKSKKVQKWIMIISTVVRIGASIALSQLINGPLEVLIAGDAITEFQARELAVQVRRVTEEADDKISLLENKADQSKKQVDIAKQRVLDEMDQSIGGRKAEYGRVAKKKEELAMADQIRHDKELNKLEIETNRILAERDAKISQIKKEQGNGYFAKRDALGRLANENSVIKYMMLILAGVLTFWEISPILTKLLMDRTPLDLVIEVEAKLLKIWRDNIVMTPTEKWEAYMADEFESAASYKKRLMKELNQALKEEETLAKKTGRDMSPERKEFFVNKAQEIDNMLLAKIRPDIVSSTLPPITTTDGSVSTSAATT